MLHRNSSLSSGSHSENLPPRALARISREIRDLHKSPPEGIRLVVDSETGVPASLGEVLVSRDVSCRDRTELDRSSSRETA